MTTYIDHLVRPSPLPASVSTISMLAAAPNRTRTFCACLECRKRKQKCNGEEPCARCSRLRLRCEYEPIKEEEARLQKFKRKNKVRQVDDLIPRDARWHSPHSVPGQSDADWSPLSPSSSLTRAASDRGSSSSRLPYYQSQDTQGPDQRQHAPLGHSSRVEVAEPTLSRHSASTSWDGQLRQTDATSPWNASTSTQARPFTAEAVSQQSSLLPTTLTDVYHFHHRYRPHNVGQQPAPGLEQASSISARRPRLDTVGTPWDQQEREAHNTSQPPSRRHRTETFSHTWRTQENEAYHASRNSTTLLGSIDSMATAEPEQVSVRSDLKQGSAIVTCICTPWLECLRVSEESSSVLSLRSTELLGHNLFEMVHPADAERLHSLVDRLHIKTGSSASILHPLTIEHLSPTLLVRPSLTSPFVYDTIRIRRKHAQSFDLFSIRLHVGGAFSGEGGPYIVASIVAIGRGATHPSPSQLSSTFIDLSDDPRYFSTQHILRSAPS